ncbi:MAG: aldehyde dehydrogenase [Acidobacteria bacterium OLB17]|nr:MAG: aldehyde dehydrogenase [Acidobacteria bacterium OLB17]
MADKDLLAQQEARDAVDAAFAAFGALAEFDQQRIDGICEAMARAALTDSERLGKMACEETGYGKPEDKFEKNRFAAEDVWNFFKGLRTVGVINDFGSIVEIASPRGVVAAIIPSTNPTSTAIFKIIIAIKSRNAIVLSPHPAAAKCIAETTRIMRDAGVREGLPADAIRCLTVSTIEGTETLMKHKRTAVILATGGTGLVRAAYSSGKPAFGVGPGNVPVFIERSADPQKAVADILTGTCFDNGTICASEQSVVVDAPIEAAVRAEFEKQGGHFLTPSEADSVAKILLTPQRTLNPGIVGRSAAYIAELAGVKVPAGTRCLIADCGGVGREFPWSVEKLSPTLAFFVANGVKEGAARCEEILRFGGMGHTAGMHTQDRQMAIEYGKQMPAARVIINSPTTHGAIGFSTDLAPSMTLGCGSWGGNVTSDNVSPIHLMDVKRVAFETKPINRKALASNASARKTEVVPPPRTKPKREDIARIVDAFLRNRPEVEAKPLPEPPKAPEPAVSRSETKETIIHHVYAEPVARKGRRSLLISLARTMSGERSDAAKRSISTRRRS